MLFELLSEKVVKKIAQKIIKEHKKHFKLIKQGKKALVVVVEAEKCL